MQHFSLSFIFVFLVKIEGFCNVINQISQVKSAMNTKLDKLDVVDLIESLTFNKSNRCKVEQIYSCQWCLEFSSLLPNGWFPIAEIVDFRCDFRLKSTALNGIIPLGIINGKSKVIPSSSSSALRIEFANEIYNLGPFKANMDSRKTKYYDFYYSDDEIAIAKSSSGGWTLLSSVPHD